MGKMEEAADFAGRVLAHALYKAASAELSKEAFTPTHAGIGALMGAYNAPKGHRLEGAKAGATGATLGGLKSGLFHAGTGAAGGAIGGSIVPGLGTAAGAAMGGATGAIEGGLTGGYSGYKKNMDALRERVKAQESQT